MYTPLAQGAYHMEANLRIFFATLALSAVVALSIRLLLPRLLAWRGVTLYWRTRFGPALVFDAADQDGTTVRLLNVSGTYQSVCYVDEGLLWLPVCEYHRTWADAIGAHWTARAHHDRRALVLGGGGFSFPKWLVAETNDVHCEVVEIDPAIVEIARTHFFLDRLEREFGTDRIQVTTGDAWQRLREATETFDLIVNDVFSKNRPLGPLGTEEGAALIRERLAPNGLYIGNVRCTLEGRGGRLLEQTRLAFEGVFDHVRVICERPENPRLVGNNCLLAWMDDGEAPIEEVD